MGLSKIKMNDVVGTGVYLQTGDLIELADRSWHLGIWTAGRAHLQPGGYVNYIYFLGVF